MKDSTLNSLVGICMAACFVVVFGLLVKCTIKFKQDVADVAKATSIDAMKPIVILVSVTPGGCLIKDGTLRIYAFSTYSNDYCNKLHLSGARAGLILKGKVDNE
jgi:heme/copper-type cytochrome/quinol oxidase subunit 2